MKIIIILLCVLNTTFIVKAQSNTTINNAYFPKDFVFGVSTSAYQIEGAWNQSGKGVNIWDFLTHNHPEMIADRKNGDTACDSYHKLDEDIKMLEYLQIKVYRFSISWSRILPTGNVKDGVNMEGVQYYWTLLKKLKERGIDAMVSIFHFDLPLNLFLKESFLTESNNAIYADYAKLLFYFFADHVKYWITFNEPRMICAEFLAFFSVLQGYDPYKCAHNIIKSHAMAYRIYEKEFKPIYGGKVSIVLNSDWDEPASQSSFDIEAAERKLAFEFGWFAHPIIHGDYPPIMKERILSMTPKYFPARLPEFSEEEKEYIKGSYDFIGLNHYTSGLIEDAAQKVSLLTSYDKDRGINIVYDSSWENSTLAWLKVVPWGIKSLLKWIDENYNSVDIFITENGYPDNGKLNDPRRINYIQSYLSNVLDAIQEHNVSVIGYSYWSLMDNFEWISGYTQKFGLYYVNFTSPNKERIKKKSVDFYKKVASTRCLVEKCV